MITNVYFVRHAESDCSVHDDFNRPLTKKGYRDALEVNNYLKDKNIDVVLSSPYRRAVDTIKPFANKNSICIKLIDDFRERKVGDCWVDDFEEFTKKQWNDFNYKLADGECLNEVQKRNIRALKFVIEKFNGKNIVIGTHGTALSTIINYYDLSYGYKEFNEIRLLMPWIVKFTFCENDCVEINKIDILNKES